MLNIYGMPLQKCSNDPLTGFLRNGCCQACDEDVGEHTICVEMTEEFLLFSRANGNDLITPQLQIGFPGLLPGDHWCVCVSRWIESKNAGLMTIVNLEATDQSVLDLVSLETLENYAIRERK